MKIKKDPQHKSAAYYLFLCLTATAVVIIALLNLDKIVSALEWLCSVLGPLIFALGLAYILNKPYEALRGLLAKALKKHSGLCKGLSVFLVYAITLGLISAFLVLMVPVVVENIHSIASNISYYFEGVQAFVGDVCERFGIDASNINLLIMSWSDVVAELMNMIYEYSDKLLNISIQVSYQLVSGAISFFMGLVISIYALISKQQILAQFDKLFTGILKPRTKDICYEIFADANKTFSGYLFGRIVDCLIFFVVSFLILRLMGMPFSLMLSGICAVFNFIPVFGPFIGTMIGALIVLMVSPAQCILFVIILIILQQIDGNILAPKIFGKITGMSTFWILVSIMLGGALFGFWGMVLSVPMFGVIITIFRIIIRIKKENREAEIRQNNNIIN